MNINKANTILDEHIEVTKATRQLLEPLINITQLIVERLRLGGKVLFCGNGGSAADAQHFAAELLGRFYLERKSIPAVALTTDTSTITCLANDYNYDIVFSRQLEALCQPNDVVVLLTTSGNSLNILKAVDVVKQKGALAVGFTGGSGGKLKECVEHCLVVPSQNVPRVQEMHLLLGHTLCEWIESAFAHD